MIRYRNIYTSAVGARWRTPGGAVIGRETCGVEDETFLRVEMLFNDIPFCPPVGFTKREPTFLIRNWEGKWFQAYGEGTSERIQDAYEYTEAEIAKVEFAFAQFPFRTRVWSANCDLIPVDEAFEKYAGGL